MTAQLDVEVREIGEHIPLGSGPRKWNIKLSYLPQPGTTLLLETNEPNAGERFIVVETIANGVRRWDSPNTVNKAPGNWCEPALIVFVVSLGKGDVKLGL